MSNLKYKLVKVSENGTVVTRIKALKDGRFFKKGDLGAIISDFAVLDQVGDCWKNIVGFSLVLLNTMQHKD